MPGLVAATLQPPQAQGLGTFPSQVMDGNGVIAAAAAACSCLSCWNGAGTGWILSRAAKTPGPFPKHGQQVAALFNSAADGGRRPISEVVEELKENQRAVQCQTNTSRPLQAVSSAAGSQQSLPKRGRSGAANSPGAKG